MYRVLIQLLIVLFWSIQTLHKSKNDLILENISLRQQLSVYKSKKARSNLTNVDRSFWVALRQV